MGIGIINANHDMKKIGLFVVLCIITLPSNAKKGDRDIPPICWGEAGARECMLETIDRWYRGDPTPLPEKNISTHGPKVPAFPGAEGFGAYSFGGRGGKLYRVTNLNDNGPGSLREAVEAEGPRIVIFDVSGTIHLEARINIYHPYLTIAGQTAPGEGITVGGRKFDVQTYDVIIRHMRFRRGDNNKPDEWTFRVRGGNHVIVDHVTITWGIDGNLGVTDMDNTTVQNSVMAKPLWDSFHPKGERGYGALIVGKHGARYSLLGNLWANNRSRVPRHANRVNYEDDPVGLLIDFRNNVIFQGYGNNTFTHSITKYNFINNYMLTNWRLIEHSPYNLGHFAGNYKKGVLVEDQWSLIDPGEKLVRANQEQANPFESGEVHTLSAKETWKSVMKKAGAWIRDEHDVNVIREIYNYHAYEIEKSDEKYDLPEWWSLNSIDSQKEVGGFPEIKSVTIPEWIDTNRNGIPDWWESKQGLDSSNPNIANIDSNENGYTNLEDYINDLEAIRKTHNMIK